ncbi:MAG: selenocysteine-specific translation elongation factor [Desulfobulbales bacterium]|nr:selenocysteine-specific translation elongation factor [Desulfobulbales bacterium]
MREIVLGTAGHVDHGKTSLVKALTGIDTDRLKEEKKRGITIELGFAFLDLPCGHRLGIVDVPGHEKFVRNMVAGAAGIDILAFVIAADEGIMPQTREHFEICRLLGIERGIIVITKKDMVEPEWLDMVKEEVRDYFTGSFLEEAPLIAVSSISGEGIDQVKTTLDRMVAGSDFSEAYGPFRLPVDRVFTIKGFGAVVTGTSISGRISLGEEVVIYPGNQRGRIRGIQVHADDVREVEAGHRTAVNIQGVDRERIRRGEIVATPGSLKPSYIMDGEFIYLSANEKKFKNRARVRIHLGTAEIMGRVVLLDDDEIAPGSTANVQLLFEEPACAWPGDYYVIRSYSPMITIGGGRILNGGAAKKKRFRESNGQVFEIYKNGAADERLLQHLKEAGPAGLTGDELAVRMGVFGKKLKKVLDGPISARKVIVVDSDSQWLLSAEVFAGLQDWLVAAVARYHRDNPLKPGISREELRSQLTQVKSQKLFQFMISDLGKRERLKQDESVVRIPGHRVALAEDSGKLRGEIASFYREAGLATPTIKELYARFNSNSPGLIREILEVMVRDGEMVKVKEDLYFHADALALLKDKLVNLLGERGEIDAQGFKELTGLSRKFSIPLLEYFDRGKVTLRIGDKRVLRERNK